ncbi:MAG: putative symporter YjmB [Opitutia bacterium UBA7350]|nr:MAG: putative symporter YjmB [Opitutae bacterium UBA7350]
MLRPLKKTELLNYSIGDLGINLNFQLIGFFLAYFYTDVFGISPAHVAGLFLAARVWDAVNDPVMGFVADHTNTRWGRFRPYVFFGAIPLNLLLLACFYVPDISPSMKVVYAYVTYILHGMVFTAVGLPYSSISAVMTQDQQERAWISTLRMFFAVIIAMSVVSIGTRPFLKGFETEAEGFFVLAICYAIVSSALLIYAGIKSKERLSPPKEKYRLKDIFPIIYKNEALLVLSLAMFLNTCIWVIANSVSLYYFKYILGNADLQSVFFQWMLPANILGVVLTPFLTGKFGKRNVFIFGSAVVVVANLTRHFAAGESFMLFTMISMVASTTMMFCSICQWGMVPDTVEYGQWKSGIRSEGIPFAFFSFTFKAGMALGGSFAAIVLSMTGYVANTELTETAQTAIIWLFNIVPAVFSLGCMVTLMFYRLDSDRFAQVLKDLEARAGSKSVEPR